MAKLSKQVRFIRIEDAVKMINENVVVSEPLVAFTFDDGLSECFDMIAPVLEEYNVNAAFFINPNFIDGDETYIQNFTDNIIRTPGKCPMNWDQLANLYRRGHIIGAHTMDHFLLDGGDIEEIRHQILGSKKAIENRLGNSCEYFAWPFGRMDQISEDAINMACNNFRYVFSQAISNKYLSLDRKVINRRHFEPFWPYCHIRYFLSKKLRY